jgi:hypothetical protein
MLGVRVGSLEGNGAPAAGAGWDAAEREALQARIAARVPFLDYLFHRIGADGVRQQFRVSGQPMFDEACRFLGYRGIGIEVLHLLPEQR